MNSITLYGSGVNQSISIPSEWNELNYQELKKYCQLVLVPNLQEAEAKVKFLLFLLESRSAVKAKAFRQIIMGLNEEDVASNYNLVNGFFSFNSMTKNLIPEIEISGHKYTGREDDFNDLTCGEFEDADIFFNQFTETRDEMAILNMMAILYRRDNAPYMTIHPQTGKLETANLEVAVEVLKQVEPWKLYASYIWFFGCKSALPDYFPTVFESGDGNKARDPHAFTKCIHAGAGPKNGTRDDIRVTLLKEFFMDMEIEAVQAKELNEKYGKH